MLRFYLIIAVNQLGKRSNFTLIRNIYGTERGFVMFRIFEEEKLITICMLSFLGISLLTRILLGWMYQSMIREADNMAATENKLLKQCKLKFANCYELNNGVSNIPVFVDKFINRLAFGPISFETLDHLSGQVMLLSVVSAGVGICKSILDGKMLGEILPFYIASFLGLYLYFSISTVADIKGKKRVLKVNLVDYLENHLSARIDVTESDMEMLYGNRPYVTRSRRKRGIAQDSGKRTVELMPIGGRFLTDNDRVPEPEAPQPHRTKESLVSEEELEALLKEFLG